MKHKSLQLVDTQHILENAMLSNIKALEKALAQAKTEYEEYKQSKKPVKEQGQIHTPTT